LFALLFLFPLLLLASSALASFPSLFQRPFLYLARPVPCKSPVFLFNGLFHERAGAFFSRLAPSRKIVNQGEPNMRFQPVQSGNRAGRPHGSRNRRTAIVEKLWDDNAGAVTTAAITRATGGDPAALRACIDRVAPRRQPLNFHLPNLVALADTPVAINAIGQG